MATEDLMALENDDLDSNETESRPGRSGILAGLAFFFALAAVALTGLLWWERFEDGEQPASELKDRLDNLEQSQASQSREVAAALSRLESGLAAMPAPDTGALESAVAELDARSQELQRGLEAQQSYAQSLQQAMEAMQVRLMAVETGLAAKAPAQFDASEQLDLAGVDYLLRLAPERLTLFGDLRSADQALALADARLAGMENPIYIGLRRHIADARQALAETELPNTIEISSEIDAVQVRLNRLDFQGEGRTPEQASPGSSATEQSWWARLKGSLASLVTVRRSASGESSRLTFEDKDLLRQGLWMQLEAARLAMMRRDQAAWEDALSRADSDLARWFDGSSPGYGAVREGIATLAEQEISPAVPDISGPWEQLQLIRQARAATAARAQAVAPGPSAEATADEDDISQEDSVEAGPATDDSQ